MKTPERVRSFLIHTAGLSALSSLIGHAPALAGPLFMGLGDLPGGSSMSRANAVSADGTTVVGASRSASGLEAFRWTFDGGMVGLGDLAGGDFQSDASDVSADGSVIVGTSESAPALYGEAFRWEGGVMAGLGDLPGGSFYSEATAVSADGSVIVGRGASEQGGEAFRWTAASGPVGLGDLPGGAFASHATAVSADGFVVVGVSAIHGDEASEAFHWTPSTGIVGLGFLPGGYDYSRANAVSADGTVVAGSSDSGVGTLAFRWTQEAGMIALGDFSLRGMSEDTSTIVGYEYYNGASRAIIWDQANGLRGLQELLEVDFGLDLGRWTLEAARDISADGTVIVGRGTNPLGRPEGWVAVIPEPSTLVYVGLFGLLAARRRERRAPVRER